MKDLFMCLLLNFVNHGKLIEANMYEGGTFSTIKLETAHGTYAITIRKDEDDAKEKEI